MWRLAREWLPEAQATAAAVFFAVNPYNLAIVYYRSDFAELLGVALLPLLLWGALQMIRCNWRYVPHLALVFAAIWLANAPEGVIATYSLALVLADCGGAPEKRASVADRRHGDGCGLRAGGVLHSARGVGTRMGADFGSADDESAAGTQLLVHALERCGISALQLEDIERRAWE